MKKFEFSTKYLSTFLKSLIKKSTKNLTLFDNFSTNFTFDIIYVLNFQNIRKFKNIFKYFSTKLMKSLNFQQNILVNFQQLLKILD